ncbi:MAG: cation:dicarboxylase symporter family transporter [Planctomycetota bacterium]|nr:cation:dicarboxylase symporter family transporter [Planctomycetota bacterium]
MLGLLGKISLTQWILIAMPLGFLLGYQWPEIGKTLDPLSSIIFMRLIKSLISPLIFSTLVVGIAGHCDDLRRMGRLALKAFLYFEVVTTLALVIGLTAVNLTHPGIGVTSASQSTLELATATEKASSLAKNQATTTSFLEHVFPASVVDAAAKNEVLQLVFWSILFGIALAQSPDKYRLPIVDFLEAIAQVMFKFTNIVMLYAPIAIGASIAVTVARSGTGVLANLAVLIGTLYGALFVFIALVLVPVVLLFRIPFMGFLRAVQEPALLAFSSASSEAALPKAMQAMETFGVPRRIVAFVMPTGYSFNLDGTTLYLALASVFCFQAAGVDLSISNQILMMFMLMLTSKGVAAVPRAGLVILSGTLISFGGYLKGERLIDDHQLTLALAAVTTILGVDALMDMARTSINLVGNCLATCVMARWEGEFDDQAASGATKTP